MKRRIILVSIIWLLTLSAPIGAQDDGEIPRRGNRLFVDDFTTLVNRWDRLHSAKFTADYADFAYQIDIRSPGVSVWSRPKNGLPLERYVIDVVATVEPTEALDGFFGLLLNFQDPENFLVFGITPDGFYEVRLLQDNMWAEQPLAEGQVNATPIESGIISYRLHVENDHDVFEFDVDDELATSFTFRELSGGYFGLYARAGHGPLLVMFDDYLVQDLR